MRSRQQSGNKASQNTCTAPSNATPRVSTPGLSTPSTKIGSTVSSAVNQQQQKVYVVPNQQLRGASSMSPMTMPSMPTMVTTLPNSPASLSNTVIRPGQPGFQQNVPANLGVRSVFGQPGPSNNFQ